MTFLELQQELSTVPGARFKSSQSSSYSRWLNSRAAELWGLEDWTFRKAYETFSVVSGDDTPTMPTTLGIVLGIWNDLGDQLAYVDMDVFAPEHYTGAPSGTPEIYTVVNKTVYLHPTPAASATYNCYFDRAHCHKSAGGAFVVGDMSLATDTPALPDELHYLLIHGATAMGSINMNDFTYQFAEQGWQSGIASMKRNYLSDVRGEPAQWGARSWGS